jgi:hypothetical protein
MKSRFTPFNKMQLQSRKKRTATALDRWHSYKGTILQTGKYNGKKEKN